MSCSGRFCGLKALKHPEKRDLEAAAAAKTSHCSTSGTMKRFFAETGFIVPNSAWLSLFAAAAKPPTLTLPSPCRERGNAWTFQPA
jgi:hypothetical protein